VAQDGERPETWLARRELVKLTANNGNGMGMPITIAVRLWPTPTSRDYRNGMALETVDKRQEESSRGVNLSEHIQRLERNNGALNPMWVEGLMGFPLGWTDLT
jgi:DNA (cytosine-5)-methyltransferase 1